MFSRYTEPTQRAIVHAQDQSRKLGFDYVGTEHLLLALIRESEGAAGQVLNKHGIALEPTRDEVRRLVICKPQGASAPGQSLSRIVQRAKEEAAGLGQNLPGPEHLLMAILADSDARDLADLLAMPGLAARPVPDRVRRERHA